MGKCKLSDLTNNQKRREFLEDYTGWDFLLDVPIVSEKYYSYPLPDNTIIVAKETEHTKGDDWWKKDERGGYYVTTDIIFWKVIGRDLQTVKRVRRRLLSI